MSMTGAIRGASSKVLREEIDGAVLDHLRNHVHLTNCIHLKNHMHKHSPMSAESSLIRDLAVLQRSRSLRDPSTSPSWHSPTIESLAKKLEQEGSIQGPRRSIGFERRRELWRGSTSSPPIPSLVTSKVSDRARIAAAESLKENDKVDSVGVESTVSRVRDGRRNKGEESSRKSLRNEPQFGSLLGSGLNPLRDVHDSARGEIIRPVDYLVPGKAVSKDKSILQKGNHGKSVYRESLSGLSLDNRDMESSSFHHRGRYIREGKTSEEPEASIQHNCNERSSLGGDLNRVNKRKFKGIRGARASIGPRNVGAQNELSVASNSLVQGASDLKYYPELQGMEGGGEHPKLEVSQAHRNGCGIPWNWSRIHDRGKTFLDMAGRSFSCGMSDSRLRKGEGPIPPGCSGSQRDVPDMPVASEYSSSPVKSDSEVLPLLIEPSGSRDSTETANWARDYSGELGIYADHNLRHNHDSDLASETRSGDQRNSRGYLRGRQRLQLGERHRSLTQKYMPTTLKDLVGQNLVTQALCNAVMKRKVGLLYVFYGPHGTGKTSCARIFAKALNCQCPEHPRPCGVCSCCIAHDLGKSRNVREVGPVSNLDFESSMNLFENMIISQPSSSQYRVLIVDDCDTLPTDSWSAISKVIDRAPRRVVFILISSSLDHLPHVIISRGQKFFFPKLKDADIIYTLQWIATKEDLEIDKDALKLIASRSDGSLRDAEMTLDQLSLLGQRISLALVQELVGLISDEKLVDLLDLALSADTVNTVKSLREIMEAGVEPLALMSQLATIITDILAGSYVFTRERLRRKFFRRPTLSKEDMERLRQALKTLSEAEKQLRTSNDRLTWLTAALLQLAPDRNYMLPSSSADTSFSQSPMALNYTNERDLPRKYNADHAEAPNRGRGLSPCIKMDDLNVGSVSDAIYTEVKMKGNYIGGNINAPRSSTVSTDITKVSGGQFPGKGHKEIEQLWESVLEKFQSNTLKQFMRQEGKLMSVSFGADPTVQLMLGSQVSKSKAEKFRGKILQAFESVFESPVTIEIRCEPRKDTREHLQDPLALPDAEKDAVQPIMMSIANDRVRAGFEHQLKRLSKDRVINGTSSMQATRLRFASPEISKSEIVEVMASPHVCEGRECMGNIPQSDEKDLESAWVEEATSSYHHATSGPLPERKRKVREQPQTQSLVKNRISLAHVIKQTEGCTQRSGWSKRKAISIAEKLEQENLRLEPRSRSLLCWKASRVTRGKLPRLRTRMRKPRSLLKLFPCSRCLSAKSPRGDFRWKLSTGNICRPWFSMLQGRGGSHASVGGSCLTIPCIHI